MANLKKSLIVLFGFIICFGGLCLAEEYKVASPFVRISTNAIGYNFVVKTIAQSVLKRTLNKAISGKYKVKFDSFSGVDLKKGKFKGLTIEGDNLSYNDEFNVSKLFIKTTSDFNYVDYKKNPIVFKTDMPMDYSIELTESDLNKNFINGDVFSILSSMIPLVTIEKPTIKIVDQRIRLKSSLKMPFAKPVKFSMSTGLKVEDGRIVLSNVETKGAKDFTDKLITLINKESMLDSISIPIFDNTDTKMSVKTVKIDNGKVYISGQLLISKTEQ